MSTGIKTETKFCLDKISEEAWAKEFTLIGGTAISLQLKHRLSEDLDFFCWSAYPSAKFDLPFQKEILASLDKLFPGFKLDYQDNRQIQVLTESNVKLQFFADNEVKKPNGFSLLQAGLKILNRLQD